jgi:thioredoxin
MDSSTFYSKLSNSVRPVVVDFWAPWCMPCRAMEPALKNVEEQYRGKVDVWRINADESHELLQKLNIYGIPTTLAFQGDKEILRHTGSQSRGDLGGFFEVALTGERPAQTNISRGERLLRLLAGFAVIGIGWAAGHSILLILAGALLVFYGVYDRCPIWRAISPRIAKLLHLSQ